MTTEAIHWDETHCQESEDHTERLRSMLRELAVVYHADGGCKTVGCPACRALSEVGGL